MNVRRWFPVPVAVEYLERLVVQIVQILSQATFAPAEKDSSCVVVEQSVMVISLVLSLKDPDWIRFLKFWSTEFLLREGFQLTNGNLDFRFATLAKLFSVNLELALVRSKAGLATQPRFIERSGFPVKRILCFQQMHERNECIASATLLCF